MADPSIWRLRWNKAIAEGAGYLLVAIICLASELLIWGLSRTLAAARLEFFSTIVGMALVFALSTASWALWKKTDTFYRRWLKTRVRDAVVPLWFALFAMLIHVAAAGRLHQCSPRRGIFCPHDYAGSRRDAQWRRNRAGHWLIQ